MSKLLRLSLIACLTALVSVTPVKAQSLLWKISGNALEAPSYLFGTIHAICPDDMHISGTLEKALLSMQRLALEIDLDDPALPAIMAQESFMPNDTLLSDLLDRDRYRLLETYFQDSIGMELRPMSTYKPLFMVGIMINRFSGCTVQSYEYVFMNMTTNEGKDVIGIETPREQLAAFGNIPLKQQAEFVMDFIENPEEIRKELSNLLAVYKTGDIEKLYTLILNSTMEYGKYEEALLLERNRRWIPRIENIILEMPTFVAVGAGHLGGPEGVIALLRERGYAVQAVPLSAE